MRTQLSKNAWVRFTMKQVKIVAARAAITIFTDVSLVFNLLCGYKMKEKFTTIDLFAILRELRERCVATKQFNSTFRYTSVGSLLLLLLYVNTHKLSQCLCHVLCWCRVLGMRVANVYDIDQKTYLIKLARCSNRFWHVCLNGCVQQYVCIIIMFLINGLSPGVQAR